MQHKKQREGPEEVGGGNKHQKMVWSTVKVAMVFMASNRMPTGVSRSHSTGEIIFDDHVDWVLKNWKVWTTGSDQTYVCKSRPMLCLCLLVPTCQSWSKQNHENPTNLPPAPTINSKLGLYEQHPCRYLLRPHYSLRITTSTAPPLKPAPLKKSLTRPRMTVTTTYFPMTQGCQTMSWTKDYLHPP